MLETIFRNTTPKNEKNLEDHIDGRFNACLNKIVPWVERRFSLDGKHVVEIGCGTGSSTAAFATHAGTVSGYDLKTHSVEAAKRRFEILGIENAHAERVGARHLSKRLADQHSGGIDAVLLYAVLEHQTLEERLECLELCWSLLRAGGVIIVGDTPNRLSFNSLHTSQLPFFDWLPPELAVRYADRSPLPRFRERMEEAARESEQTAIDVYSRWGRGPSYHEFELVLGPLQQITIADGFDPDVLEWQPLLYDEILTASYFVSEGLDIPLGFARRSLTLILRKPVPGEPEREPIVRDFKPLAWEGDRKRRSGLLGE